MLLGAQLRRLRETATVTRDDAGYHIRASGSKISRMELGRVSFKERDVTDLLELYGVDDLAEREKLIQLTREANATPWYQKFQDVVPDWFHVFVGLEEAAQLIRVYEVQFVPGLLQTEEYARAVINAGVVTGPRFDVERQVAVKMERQIAGRRHNPVYVRRTSGARAPRLLHRVTALDAKRGAPWTPLLDKSETAWMIRTAAVVQSAFA